MTLSEDETSETWSETKEMDNIPLAMQPYSVGQG